MNCVYMRRVIYLIALPNTSQGDALNDVRASVVQFWGMPRCAQDYHGGIARSSTQIIH